jgi:hypothetical protein
LDADGLAVDVALVFAAVLVHEVERVAREDDLFAGAQAALDEVGVGVACGREIKGDPVVSASVIYPCVCV